MTDQSSQPNKEEPLGSQPSLPEHTGPADEDRTQSPIPVAEHSLAPPPPVSLKTIDEHPKDLVEQEKPVESPPQPAPAPQAPVGRLMSLDALRGFDMFWIIGGAYLLRAFEAIATQGGDSPSQFQRIIDFLIHHMHHADWEIAGLLTGLELNLRGVELWQKGMVFYDLIFPLFVFIVGTSLVYSLTRNVAEKGRANAVRRVLKRSVVLYALGIIFSGGFATEWPDIRLMGVLNRIALCYLCAGLLFLFLKARGLILVCIGLLVSYWALMSFVALPEIGAGSMEKGANLANYIDEHYLSGMKWDDTWDPEGLLSTLPAVATCLLGVFSGLLLINQSYSNSRKVFYLLFGGAAALVLGWIWGVEFPVIKKIWTSSYVLVTGGWSAILLGLFYLVIDVWHWRWWCQPFVWIGLNPITVYMANNIIGFHSLANRFAGGDIRNFLNDRVYQGLGEVLVNLVALSFAVLLCWLLHRKKIFIRV